MDGFPLSDPTMDRFRSVHFHSEITAKVLKISKLQKVKNTSFELNSRDSVLISKPVDQNGNSPKPCWFIRDEMGIR